MRLSTLFFRRVHKWIGLILGLQFLVWTVSGAMMALLDMERVAGGPRAEAPPAQSLPAAGAWPGVVRQLEGTRVQGVKLRRLLDRPVYEIKTKAGVRLFDVMSGRQLVIGPQLARTIAETNYAGAPAVASVARLETLTLAVREHSLPIWRVDFKDDQNSSFYVSGATGELLERRNDSWRTWDFFWMLHNMDYANRTSFNHPLIVMIGFGVVWLALTGVYLLLKTAWKPDLRALRRALPRLRLTKPGMKLRS